MKPSFEVVIYHSIGRHGQQRDHRKSKNIYIIKWQKDKYIMVWKTFKNKLQIEQNETIRVNSKKIQFLLHYSGICRVTRVNISGDQ